jgi:hypothetical protein
MTLCAYAGNYASCTVNEIPGAYVYVEVFNYSSRQVEIVINSYVVKEGAVDVEFDWEKSDGERGHESYVVHFTDGKAIVKRNISTTSSKEPYISNVKVYNPVCKAPN